MTPRRLALVAAVLLMISAISIPSTADVNDACTDTSSEMSAECVQGGVVTQLVRLGCSYVWEETLCAHTRYPDPGYVATSDPHPGSPLQLRVGAVHEHSSYSDSEVPFTLPRDYYTAAKTGHNTADAGGDTGVKLDFMFGSDHTETMSLPITTAYMCIDPTAASPILDCWHGFDQDHYFKWESTLRQARETATKSFTPIRGFEWTNDMFNHMNVYFSRNYRIAKIDGSYVTMEMFWRWLRTPAAAGGGSDGLVTFNHPGRQPGLSPFDEGLPHNDVLEGFGESNWNDVAYVPDADRQVAAMEVNGGDDIEYYVTGLRNGWHYGAVANEDEHEREWATSNEGKTLILTRGNTPKDYYWAFSQQRSIAIANDLVGGKPGTKATYPTIHYFADGASVNDRNATVLGSTIVRPGKHTLKVDLRGVPAGYRVALVSDTTEGQAKPVQLGTVGRDTTFRASRVVSAPKSGEDWYFVVICPKTSGTPSQKFCGTDQNYSAVTAPIWLAAPGR